MEKHNQNASQSAHAVITGEYDAFDVVHRRIDVAEVGLSINSGFFKVDGNALVNACGDADLLALSRARVYSSGNAKIDATDNAMVVATDQVKVTASGSSAVLATGFAKVYASDSVMVTAMDGSEIYASGNVRIQAFDHSTIYASGDSEVEVSAITMCTVFLYGNATMKTVA